MRELKQSATVVVLLGPFLDSTDGNTVETGLTISQADVRLSKNGGDMAQKDNAANCTHDEIGYYSCTLSVVDVSTLGHLKIMVHETGALSVWNEFSVVDKNYWASKYSSDIFDVNTIQVGGTVQTALDINDILDDTNELQGDDIPGRLDTLSGSVTVIDGNVDSILADTDELQTDDIPGRIDTMSASISAIPTTAMRGTDNAALAANAITSTVWTDARAGYIDELAAANIPADLDAVLADTNELQTDDIPGRLDTLSSSVTVIDTAIGNIQGTGFASSTSSLAAIRTRGDIAWTTGAGGSSPTVEQIRTEMDDNSTKLAAIIIDTSATIPGRIDTLSGTIGIAGAGLTDIHIPATGLDSITKDSIFALAMADSIWDEVLTAATHNIATSAGRRLRDIASNIVLTGTSPDTAGTANTAIRIELDGDASSTDGAYDPGIIVITGGTGIGQARQIFEYDGANKYAYINRTWKVIPDNTSVYTIVGSSGDTHVNEGLATGGGNTSIIFNALASSVDDTYVGQIVFLFAGTGEDQARMITAYNGTSKVATIDRAWETNPVNGETIYAVLPMADLTTAISKIDVIDGIVDAILVDTSATIPGRLDTLSSSVTVIDTAVSVIQIDTSSTIPGLINGLNNISAANVNAEVLDVMNVDTHSEPGTGAPGATVSIFNKINWMYKSFRNKKRQTATVTELYNDDGSTIGSQRTTAGSSSTSTIGEWETG